MKVVQQRRGALKVPNKIVQEKWEVHPKFKKHNTMSHFIYWGGGNTKGENSKIRYGEEADFILPSSDRENVFYNTLRSSKCPQLWALHFKKTEMYLRRDCSIKESKAKCLNCAGTFSTREWYTHQIACCQPWNASSKSIWGEREPLRSLKWEHQAAQPSCHFTETKLRMSTPRSI